MKYIVIETQKTPESVAVVPPVVCDDLATANQTYHTKLAYASVSEVAYHSVTMLTDEGGLVKTELHTHLPEPETEA